MRVIFGGTFDPVHIGHQRMAEDLSSKLSAESVYLMPCYRAVHKQKVGASATHRLNMLKLVSSGSSKLLIDDREIKRGKPSYTIDSLLELREEIDSESLCLVMGEDAVNGISLWRDVAKFSSLTNLIIIERPGVSVGVGFDQGAFEGVLCSLGFVEAQNAHELELSSAGKYLKLKLSLVDVSSTMIRGLLEQKKGIQSFVTGAVNEYICDNGLYRN